MELCVVVVVVVVVAHQMVFDHGRGKARGRSGGQLFTVR